MREIKDGDAVWSSDGNFLQETNTSNLLDGDLFTPGGPDARYQEYKKSDGYFGMPFVLRVPKQEPQVGDIVKLKDCMVGWEIEITQESVDDYMSPGYLSMKQIVTSQENANGDVSIKNFLTPGRMRVKIISKGEPKVGDIVKLEDCKVGWEVEFTEESMLDWASTLRLGTREIIIKLCAEKAYFDEECTEWCVRSIRVKVISKGEPEAEKEGTNLTKEVVAQALRNQTNKKPFAQQHLTTKDFQETMGKPSEEEKEAVCDEGPSNEWQTFDFPQEFMIEMVRKIKGMPQDAYFFSNMHISFKSMEFQDTYDIEIIRDGDGWKVEGT